MYNQIQILALFMFLSSLVSFSLPTQTQTQPISSNSVLVALLDSRYTELSELIEKALLLPVLENAVLNKNLTFFAPDNSALRRELTTEFRQFLLEPRNLKTLQSLLLSHIFPGENVEENVKNVGNVENDDLGRLGLGHFGKNVENKGSDRLGELTRDLNLLSSERVEIGYFQTNMKKNYERVNLGDFRGNVKGNKERVDLGDFRENVKNNDNMVDLGDFEQSVKNSDLGSSGQVYLGGFRVNVKESMKNSKERVVLGDFEIILKNNDLGRVNSLANSLSNEKVDLSEFGTIVNPYDVVRPDGVIHGISKMRIPKMVMNEFNNRRSLRAISAIKPEGAPEVDLRTHRLKKPVSVPVGSAPVLPIYDAMAPGPSLAPAPAPGPGGGHRHFDGEAQVKDFIQTLVHYGGYNELADILVNLTSLSTEMGRLVSEGYVLTVLAPNDEAMAKLTTDRLSEPGAPEEIVYYHIIPEYQTEESMYNSVRRFGKVRYDTLRLPHKVTAEEADGSVKFGFGDGSAYLFDPDIYTDGRISVQGIDGVLFPSEETKTTPLVKEGKSVKVVEKARRGKLLEIACGLLGAVGHDSRFTSCQ